MRYLRMVIGVLVLLAGGYAIAPAQQAITLVESVPVETTLGDSATVRTVDAWLDMIGGARRYINIEQFYLSVKPGTQLQKVIDALVAAAQRGVRIRWIADGKFYKIYPTMLDSLNQLSNIEVRIIRTYNQMGGVQHAKFFVVDGKEVFVGSQNFDWRALEHIHELGVRIRSPQLARLVEQIFEIDWHLAGGQLLKDVLRQPSISGELITPQNPLYLTFQGEPVTLYPSFSPKGYFPRGLLSDEAAILQLLATAKNKVVIQLLSYNPQHNKKYYATLEVALRQAAARGVTIQLLVSNWNKRKPGISYLKSLQVLPNISVRFTNLPQWSGGFIPFARVEHCKFMVVDDSITFISTANWAHSYFYASRNWGITLHSPAIARIVTRIFYRSWDSAYAEPVKPCETYQPPRISQ